ncbi:helix-turn-helix domain-containing protein [Thioclava sp. GXIMD2076]|uniref:Helix-turn-helix domain-containing protein n=1 Tax=Thioclava kandeliae TaxID=3070818 RepID=A0ABV1SDY6_9RHOB
MIPLTTNVKSSTFINAQALPAKDRFAFWNDVIHAHFCPAENSARGNAKDFEAKIRMRPLGSLGVSELETSGMTSKRTVNCMRKMPLDSFFVSRLTRGQAHVAQSGRDAVQKTGDFIMYDANSPFQIDMAETYGGNWIRVPRSLLLNRMPHAEAMTARALSGNTPLGKMLTHIMLEIQDLDLPADSPATQRVANSLIDLLTAAFECEHGISQMENSRHIGLLDKAKGWILANLEDCDIDSDRLVDVLGVSRRTLNRIFATENTTPIRWLWSQRLKRAHEMLCSGHELRVSEVALKCGFSDFSHFSRAFKSEFGLTPKSLLKDLH